MPSKLSSLKAAIELSCSVRVFVPSTVDVDLEDRGAHEEWVNTFSALLARLFGGPTSTKALGAWIDQLGHLVKEDVEIVFAYCNQSDLEEHVEEIVAAAEDMKRALRQEAVALEVNNKLYLL